MAEMQNVISVSGAVWSGSAVAANALSASGAIWAFGGATASAGGALPLGGAAGGTVAVTGGANGLLPLGGMGRLEDGALVPSARRVAAPGESLNGGRLVRRH